MSLRATGDTPRGRHLHRPGNSPQRLAKRPHERETLRRIFPKRTTYDVHRDPHAGAGARRTGIIHGDLSSRRRRPRLPLLLPRRPPGRRPHRRPAGGLRHPGLAGRAGAGPGWVAAGGGPWRGSEHARGSWLWRQGVRGFCVLHVAEAWVTAPGSAYTIRQGKHCRRRRVGRALRPPSGPPYQGCAASLIQAWMRARSFSESWAPWGIWLPVPPTSSWVPCSLYQR